MRLGLLHTTLYGFLNTMQKFGKKQENVMDGQTPDWRMDKPVLQDHSDYH